MIPFTEPSPYIIPKIFLVRNQLDCTYIRLSSCDRGYKRYLHSSYISFESFLDYLLNGNIHHHQHFETIYQKRR